VRHRGASCQRTEAFELRSGDRCITFDESCCHHRWRGEPAIGFYYFVSGTSSSRPLNDRHRQTDSPRCCNDPLNPQPVWVGESVVLRLGRVPTWSSLRHPRGVPENAAWDADRNVLFSRVAVQDPSQWHRHSWLCVPRCQGLRIGSRDGEVEHKRQSGHLFDPALRRISSDLTTEPTVRTGSAPLPRAEHRRAVLERVGHVGVTAPELGVLCGNQPYAGARPIADGQESRDPKVGSDGWNTRWWEPGIGRTGWGCFGV
jgi:hypothetical protein